MAGHESAVASQPQIVVKDPPKFDLDSYIANYTGRTKLERLEFIGAHSIALRAEALKAAVIAVKQGKDVNRYGEIQGEFAASAPNEPEALYDSEWAGRVSKQNTATETKLLAELKEYKNNLIKESIRMGNEDAGNHFYETGNLEQAYEYYGKMRNDVSMNSHIISLSRHLVEVSIARKDWIQVLSNVQKIHMIVPPTDEKQIQTRSFAKVASGIAYLSSGRYWDAAQSFLSVEPGMGSSLSDMISANDVAVYGGVCALASMDRQQLQEQVLENTSFRTYLETEPHVRRAIASFVNSRYASCLTVLEGYRNDYLLDIFLQPQVAELYSRIRSKSIVQYFIPFSCVTLESLEEAFAMDGSSLEDELIGMIKRGVLDARIDTQARTLVNVPKAPRAELQKQAIASAKSYEREMRLRLIRMNIIGSGLEIPAAAKKGTNWDMY